MNGWVSLQHGMENHPSSIGYIHVTMHPQEPPAVTQAKRDISCTHCRHCKFWPWPIAWIEVEHTVSKVVQFIALTGSNPMDPLLVTMLLLRLMRLRLRGP
jgi:hypothetical protein